MRRFRLFDDQSRYLDRFGLLLVVTIASICVLSLVDMTATGRAVAIRWEETIAAAMVAVALVLALRASGVARLWQRIADGIVALMVAFLLGAAIVSTVDPDPPRTTWSAPVLVVLLSMVAPVVVTRRLLQHREVKRATLLGAIAGYLLIPVAYFYAFLALNTYLGEPFFGEVEPTTSFMYFSLGAISTLGVPSLEASTDLGRLLATSEAIVGQVYLVTFVALLVGLYAAGRMRARTAEDTNS